MMKKPRVTKRTEEEWSGDDEGDKMIGISDVNDHRQDDVMCAQYESPLCPRCLDVLVPKFKGQVVCSCSDEERLECMISMRKTIIEMGDELELFKRSFGDKLREQREFWYAKGQEKGRNDAMAGNDPLLEENRMLKDMITSIKSEYQAHLSTYKGIESERNCYMNLFDKCEKALRVIAEWWEPPDSDRYNWICDLIDNVDTYDNKIDRTRLYTRQ